REVLNRVLVVEHRHGLLLIITRCCVAFGHAAPSKSIAKVYLFLKWRRQFQRVKARSSSFMNLTSKTVASFHSNLSLMVQSRYQSTILVRSSPLANLRRSSASYLLTICPPSLEQGL